MDPYSLSVEREASKNIEENERECFKDAIVSSRSLNKGFVEPTKLKNAYPEIIACVIAASFHISVGLAMSFSAILIPNLETDNSEIHATKGETSWIASIIVVAAPIGSLLGGILMEYVGRLRTLQIGTIPAIAGWIMIALSKNVPMILVGRVLGGVATAMATSPAIVYITEVARPELRGSLMSFGPTLASFGMVLSYLKGTYLPWRTVAWLSIIYSIIPIFLIQFFVYESPVWLVSKGRIDEAKRSLERLYKSELQAGKVSAAEQQFVTIMKEHEIKLSEQRRSKNSSLGTKMRAFLKPTGWKPMTILFFFFLFQQFSGIYVTLFYAVTWIHESGAQIDEYWGSVFVGLTRFFCSMVNTWLLRRYKRRVLCIISAIGMSICMGISGYFTLQIKNHNFDDPSAKLVPVIGLLMFVVMSMVGFLTIPWTMTAELFPTEIRGIAQSMSYAMANILMFAAVQSYRSLTDYLGGPYAIQWFFGATSIAGAVFVWLLLPETHGKKLSEIEEYFHNNFLAFGADAKAKRRQARRRSQRKEQTPLNQTTNGKKSELV